MGVIYMAKTVDAAVKFCTRVITTSSVAFVAQ